MCAKNSRKPVEKFKLPKMRLYVYHDPDAESPLTYYYTPFDLVSWAPNVPGTKPTPSKASDDWAKDWREENPNGQLWPVWIYDHGDIALRIAPTPEAAGFDAAESDVGFVGFCVMTESLIQSEWDGDVTKAREYVDRRLDDLILWINGNAWFYELTEWDSAYNDWEYPEAFHGFYGVDWRTSGMVEEWPSEFQALVSSPKKKHSPSVTP
jgi:hypothetical protein